MERIIFHIDFDSFFASVEQQYHPELRNRPVGITAHNGRTAIIAASREAKKRGVQSPSRTFDAQKICPDIQFVTADFVKYYEISKKFLTICSDYSPFVEMFSLDEVFMDITQTANLFGGTQGVINRIKQRIQNEIGEYITVSVGISYNKLLAKLGSGLDKPNGITYIKKDNLNTVFTRAKLSDVCGIGPRIEFRLHLLGIYTLLQLRDTPLGFLIKEFGNIEGHFLHNVGYGWDDRQIIPYTQAPEVKSVGRQYCLPHNEYNWKIILQNVYELCEEVGIKLRRLNKKAQAFGFSLYGDVYIHEIKTRKKFFDTGDEMFAIVKKDVPLSRYVLNKHYIRRISVWAGDLINAYAVPMSLFSQERRKEKLIQTIDKINNKFGDHTIRNGFLLYADKLTTVPNGWGADRYDRTLLAKNG